MVMKVQGLLSVSAALCVRIKKKYALLCTRTKNIFKASHIRCTPFCCQRNMSSLPFVHVQFSRRLIRTRNQKKIQFGIADYFIKKFPPF